MSDQEALIIMVVALVEAKNSALKNHLDDLQRQRFIPDINPTIHAKDIHAP